MVNAWQSIDKYFKVRIWADMTQKIVSISHFNCTNTVWRRDAHTGLLRNFVGAPYCRSCAMRVDIHKYISVTEDEFNPDHKNYKEFYRCRPCLDAIIAKEKVIKAAADSTGTYEIDMTGENVTDIKRDEEEVDWH